MQSAIADDSNAKERASLQIGESGTSPFVFANFGDELVGRSLSRQLHSSEMANAEGYFQPLDHTLVLRKNLIGSDGSLFLGTALHELVHGLMHVDFSDAPMWLNEGLAALHEEYGSDGPQDNYRLLVAQMAMRSQGRWPSPEQVLRAPSGIWSSDYSAMMAAASRYLCMFLLKNGWLSGVYKGLRDAPAGVSAEAVLTNVTGLTLPELSARWKSDISARDAGRLPDKWRPLIPRIEEYVGELQSRF